MVDLNEVLVFTRVVESGSFSGAAKLLGQPRATVSRKVTQLEESLGIRLLQRTTRKLNLTEPGREYYVKCSSALSEIEDANQMLTEAQQTPSGVLRIAAPLASQTGFMCDWINEFLSIHKNVSVKVKVSDDVVDLIEGGIDVSFRAGKLKDSSLVARQLGSSTLVLCASPKYLKQAPELHSLNDLKNHAAVLYGSAQETATWHLQAAGKNKGKKGKAANKSVQVQGRVIVNSMEFALQSCVAGLGVSLLPIAMIGELAKTKQLQIVLPDYATDAGGLYIVYPSKSHLSVTVRTFVDFITEKASKGMPWNH